MNERFKERLYKPTLPNKKNFILKFIKQLYLYLFNNYILLSDSEIEQCDDLFVISQERTDYRKLFESIYKCVDKKKLMISLQKSKKIELLKIVFLFNNLHEFSETKCISLQVSNNVVKKALTFNQRLELFFSYLNLKFVECKLKEKSYFGAKRLTVLGDVWPFEIIVVDGAKQFGLQTVSCQHGLFIENTIDHSLDKLNYMGNVTDTYLAWGKTTKQLIEKYNQNKPNVIICGNPSFEYSSMRRNNDGVIGIVLDQPRFEKPNMMMIKLIEEFAKAEEKRVLIRKHPQDKMIENIKLPLFMEFETDLTQCEFIVGHTSTMLVTYMLQGYKVLRFKTDEKASWSDDSVEFDSLSSLKNKLGNVTSRDGITDCVQLCGLESKKAYKLYYNT